MATQQLDQETIARTQDAAAKLKACADSVRTLIQGQDELIELALACAVSGGHMLIEGPPGTGKTRFVKALANVLNLTTSRIQCTNDLMPMDVMGSEITREDSAGQRKLEFIPGPLFAQMVFVDEISRASPKTQSAFLQMMQEGFVTVNGKDYLAPNPFILFATRNPLDTEGSNPLPQAQLDRFRARPVVGNIGLEEELAIARHDANKPGATAKLFERAAAGEDLTVRKEKPEVTLPPVLGRNDLILYQSLSRDLPLSDELNTAIVQFVRKLRPQEASADDSVKSILHSGSDGQRTAEALRAMVRGLALVRGDYAPGFEHLEAVAYEVTGHRISFKRTKDAGKDKELIQQVLDNTLA